MVGTPLDCANAAEVSPLLRIQPQLPELSHEAASKFLQNLSVPTKNKLNVIPCKLKVYQIIYSNEYHERNNECQPNS